MKRILSIIAFVLVPVTLGGSIEVEIRERDGGPVEGVWVSIVPQGTGDPWSSYTSRGGATAADGKVLLREVSSGTYTFDLRHSAVSDLLLPGNNPWVKVPVVTLPKDSSKVQITIELWPGIPLDLTVMSLHTNKLRGKLVLRHVETGATFEHSPSRDDGSELHVDRTMVEGRWEAHFDAPPGFVIRELSVNGEAIPGAVAEMDTSLDPRRQYVHWALASPCEVWGKVLAKGGGGTRGVTIVATPLEPGPWYESELARGRRHDRVPVFRWEPDRIFHVRMPEGLWRVQPEGDALEGSDPPHVDLWLAPGDVIRQDFSVTVADSEKRPALEIHVKTPAGGRVSDALVAVFREGKAGEEEPLQTAWTEKGDWRYRLRYGRVRFEGLPAGRYDVVAGHPDWLDGQIAVTYDPETEEGRRRKTVILTRGAMARALAFDTNDKSAVPRVEVTFAWTGETYPSLLDNSRLDAARRLRRTRTDATGYAVVKGLALGTYRVEARVTGQHQMTRFANVRLPGGTAAGTLDLEIVSPTEYDLEIPVRDGASIEGHLRCDDRGPLPPSAAFRVYAAGLPWDGIELGPGSQAVRLIKNIDGRSEAAEPVGEPDAELDRDRVLLSGQRLDRFTIGPLESEDYVLAARPAGYAGWAWAYGTDLREDAALFILPHGQSTDLGTIEMLCEPAVVLQPHIASGAAIPDMELGSYKLTVTARSDTGDEIELHPVLETRAGHLLVKGLVDGMTDVTLELRHPHLSPPILRHEIRGLDLERGSRPVKHIAFVDAGGAIVVQSPSPTVRLMLDDTIISDVGGAQDVARFDGLSAGIFRVVACDDADCAAAGIGREVRVERYRTRHVDLSTEIPDER